MPTLDHRGRDPSAHRYRRLDEKGMLGGGLKPHVLNNTAAVWCDWHRGYRREWSDSPLDPRPGGISKQEEVEIDYFSGPEGDYHAETWTREPKILLIPAGAVHTGTSRVPDDEE